MQLRTYTSSILVAVTLTITVSDLASAVSIAVPISTLDNAVYVQTNTADYNDWAVNCANVAGGGSSCTYDDSDAPKNNDTTLFFWGTQDQPTTSNLALTWSGSEPSDTIQSVRLTTLLDSTNQPLPIGPEEGGVNQIFTFAESPKQGAGLFSTYARPGLSDFEIDQYAENGSFSVAVTVPSAGGGGDAEVTLPIHTTAGENRFIQLIGGEFTPVPFPKNVTESVAGGGSLAEGDAVNFNFWTNMASDATDDEDPDTSKSPSAYFSDFIVQFNAPEGADNPQAGMILDVQDADGNDLSGATAYERSGDDLTAVIRRQADGEAMLPGAQGTVRLLNQGGDGSVIGNGEAAGGTVNIETRGNASSSSAGGEIVSLAVGAATDASGYDFSVAATPNVIDYQYVDGDPTRGIDLAATLEPLENSMQVRVGDPDDETGETGEAGTYVRVAQQTVGPLMGLDSTKLGELLDEDGPSGYFGPGDYTISMDDLEPGEPLVLDFTMANLFGEDFGELTNLVVSYLGGTGSADAGLSLAAEELTADCTGLDAEITLTAATGSNPMHKFSCSYDIPDVLGSTLNFLPIEFQTDQSMLDEKTGAVVNDAIFSFGLTARTPVSAPFPLLLLGSGLFVLAGFRSMRPKARPPAAML